MAKSKVKEVVEKVKAAVASESAEESAEVDQHVAEEELSDIEKDPFAEIRAAKAAVPGKKEKGDRPGVSRKKVKLTLPAGCHLNINNVPYQPGVHYFEEHQIPSILEMVDKKFRADLSVSIGKKYMVDRLADRSLSIKEQKD